LHIRRACDESLRRMQTDHIDLYQMHHVDRDAPWDEIWQAMETLVQQGKVLYVGSSNFAGWHVAQANEAAKQRHFLGLVSEQSLYNLLDRTIELEVIPACKAYGLGLIPWSPLKGGVLSGLVKDPVDLRSNPNAGRRTGDLQQRTLAKHKDKLERFDAFCKARGQHPADVALAWTLANPVVTAPIVGPRTMEHLLGALAALEIELDAAAMKELDAIFPGPGGPAPEAYAW